MLDIASMTSLQDPPDAAIVNEAVLKLNQLYDQFYDLEYQQLRLQQKIRKTRLALEVQIGLSLGRRPEILSTSRNLNLPQSYSSAECT